MLLTQLLPVLTFLLLPQAQPTNKCNESFLVVSSDAFWLFSICITRNQSRGTATLQLIQRPEKCTSYMLIIRLFEQQI